MTRLFGTDGVRGLANKKLTASLALKLGAAAAEVLTKDNRSGSRRPVAVVGRDPRASGEMLAAALSAGMASRGVDVLRVGVLPTPAVAYLTDFYGADMGVVISASHNPMPDNGIKFFSKGGHKLPDSVEDEIEMMMETISDGGPTGHGIGRVIEEAVDAQESYLKHLKGAIQQSLEGITVVVDCANGAASEVAPLAYSTAGANVIAIHNHPNAYNINDNCGSTHIDQVIAAVKEHGADLGLAHDGDADRCLAVDAEGNVVDGDQIMAILALAMKENGELRKSTLVATVMSNLGLRLAMKESGINLITTQVGDRYVLEALNAGGYSLGGEQSGHIVLPDHGTTGDGTLTGLSLMARMAETGLSLKVLAGAMAVLPQVLINVPVSDKTIIMEHPEVIAALEQATDALGETGRVLLRASGTEELFRVMVEAAEEETARRIAGELAALVAKI
ncbi:phosphoglucosamine mutase [Corynebacterium pseudotuberculosis]|uniref:Phosphoglucosamine mutase n=1 Tax=Corynebacterium pseudotuberculosis (strain C231) TaxID=681645 RepID=D9QEH7_CORP2|nr:phosphoglucosamine mutase [Corynebacterium pseudotuberculosis]ADK28198.1 phosphoglucosamine mutase [Corynebacterium pseudotuberculosis FRC41]ADL09900.1 phosphoglucosamine mutase [Corynebacterium pseudotuberculosis C231]ADL20307.1 phosphoglucosamine mutase [Corynebacterium pseudotuberculosis 1002]ADO25692.1 phosphoglucosamine mutase [Corynebacterium pseudotuberculosis I19]AEK91742.1 Phosphoglucosamine mutase [Corynebacterium pseudotuberculosis PAT10]